MALYSSNEKMNKIDEDRIWVDRVLRGEKEAFGPLVERHQNSIFTLVKRIVKDSDEAQDLTQTIFIKAYEALHTFNDKSLFSTWLNSIAYNAAVGFYRKKKPLHQSFDEQLPSGFWLLNTEEDPMEKEVLLQQLENALAKLNAEDNALIHFYYTQNYSIERISEITRQTPSNVKVRLFRIRKKLSEMMRNQPETCLN